MTKKIIVLLILHTLVFSCTVNKYPEFVGVEDIKVLDKNIKSFTLSAKAKFENPNDVGGTLQTDDLRVVINDVEVATIKTESFKVPSKKEFTIPLTVKVLTKDILGEKGITGILNSLKTKTLNVEYGGIINYQLGRLSYPYSVDYSDEIKL